MKKVITFQVICGEVDVGYFVGRLEEAVLGTDKDNVVEGWSYDYCTDNYKGPDDVERRLVT